MARRKRNRKEDGHFNVWRSYSDMMAGVVLLFVLIMCVTLFQAQKNYTDKLAEQEERLRIQDEYAEDMALKEAELEEQDQLLADQKDKLAEQNLTLEEMQEALEKQAAILEEKQGTLEEQEAMLEEQQSTMEQQASILETQKNRIAEQKGELDAQKALLDEQKKLLADKQAQIDRIVGVKAEVIEALQKEFAANNIDVEIDAQTGAMTLDAKVMFDYDSAILSEEGKQVLRQVMPIYCKVLLSTKYRDNIAEILIDGYTDTDGTYEKNLELSQNRSLACRRSFECSARNRYYSYRRPSRHDRCLASCIP